MNIATVIYNLQKGDKDTFRDVVHCYSGILMTVAKIYTHNKADAEDVLQDSFISIYQNIRQFKGNEEKAFVGWMKKIVTNASFSKYRKMRYSREQLILENVVPQSEEPIVLRQYEYEELMKAVLGLPFRYRQVVGLYAIDGYSHKEVATMLNIQSSSSRSLYSRALRMLENQLSPKQKIV